MTGILAAAAAAASASLPALSVYCDPNAVGGLYDGELNIGLTDYTTAVIAGGVPPCTVLWEYVSGDAYFTPVPDASTLAIQFSFPGSAPSSAVYRVIATDSAGQTAQSEVEVTANQ